MVCIARYQRQGEQSRGVHQQCARLFVPLPRVCIASSDSTREDRYPQKRQTNREGAQSPAGLSACVSQEEVNKLVGIASESETRAASEITFLVGESVKVVDGPFNGFKGQVQEVSQDKHKLKVVVTIFDRQTPLELGFNQVEKE